MNKSFYTQTEEFRNSIINQFNSFNIANLYLKEKCSSGYQLYIVTDNITTLEIYQQRLYPDTLCYKTNGVGEVMVKMYDNNDNQSEYTYNEFLNILSWHFDNNYRIIVPSDLLSNEIIKTFTMKVITNELPTMSTTNEQIIYFNELDGGEVLLEMFPSIVLQNKPL